MARSPSVAALSSVALSSPKTAASSSPMLAISPRVAAAAAGEEFTDVRITWQLVTVTVPPGPLGILLDSSVPSAAVLEGFAAIDAHGTRGAIELHGGILPGSVLASVNQYDFVESQMLFAEIGQVLRETSHLERDLCFKVPVPVSTQDSTPPKSEDEGWSETELVQELALVSPASVELQDSHSSDERSDSPPDSSYDNISDSDLPPKLVVSTPSSTSSTASSTRKGWSLGGFTLPTMPTKLNMPNLPNLPPFVKSPFNKSATTPPHSSASSTDNATTLTTNAPEVAAESEEVQLVTVEAPAGPLGLNLDGGILDHAVVVGFVSLPDGSVGALESHGGIVPGAVLIEINEEDVSSATLDEIRVKLGELSGAPRTLVFRLPPPRPVLATPSASTRTLPIELKEDLDKRRKMELALVVKYDKATLNRKECWFVLDAQWMNNWVNFAARGGPLPGPITNEVLLEPDWKERMESQVPGRPDTPLKGLALMKDYRCVTPMVWCLFVELHGLGEAPLLPR